MKIEKIIFVIICLEVFLVPLFFLPGMSGGIDLNKEFLFIGLTAAALVLWFSQGLKTRQFKVVYVPLFLLAPGFLILYTIAVAASRNRPLSFLGLAQGGTSPSWFGVLFLVLFYFLIVNYVKTKKQIKIIVGLVILANALGLALFAVSVFKKSLLPWSIAASSSFNPIGSLTNFSLILGLGAILALGLFLDKGPFLEKQVKPSRAGALLQPAAARQGSVAKKKLSFFSDGISATGKKISRFWPGTMNLFLLVFILAALLAMQLVNFKMVWLVLLVVSFVFLVLLLSFYHHLNVRFAWLWLLVLFFILALTSYALDLPALYDLKLPAEVSLSPKLSREIALKVVLGDAKSFFLGSGPSTFNYAFSQYRPASFNQNILWQWRFNRPSGYLWETLVAAGWLGMLGLVVFILFLLTAGFFVLLRPPRMPILGLVSEVSRSRAPRQGPSRVSARLARDPYVSRRAGSTTMLVERPSQSLFLIVLLACFVGVAAAFIQLTPNFATIFLFWLIAGLVSVTLLAETPGRSRQITFSYQASPKYALIVSFIAVLVFSFIAFLFIGGLRLYLADFYNQKAAFYFNQASLNQVSSLERQEKLTLASAAIKKCLGLQKNQPQYLMFWSRISFNQAVEEALKPQEVRDLKVVANYLAVAVNQAKKATDLAPQDAGLWEARANLLTSSLSFTQQVKDWAIKSQERVMELEPTNPWPKTQLGLLYFNEGRPKESKPADKIALTRSQEYFDQALSLKPDLAEARLGLMSTLEILGDYNGAITTIKDGLELGLGNAARFFYELGRLSYNQFILEQGEANQAKSGQELLNQAAVNFEKALNLNPAYANALYSLGLTYEKQAAFDFGKREAKLNQAVRLLEEVLALNPGRQDLKDKLEDLRGQLE